MLVCYDVRVQVEICAGNKSLYDCIRLCVFLGCIVTWDIKV